MLHQGVVFVFPEVGYYPEESALGLRIGRDLPAMAKSLPGVFQTAAIGLFFEESLVDGPQRIFRGSLRSGRPRPDQKLSGVFYVEALVKP